MAQDPYKYFRIEAREILDQLGQGALDLEKGAPAPDLVARLLRLAHTLKGAARVVRQHEIAGGAHALEDAIVLFRDAPNQVPSDRADRVVSLVDEIGDHLARLAPPPPREPARPDHEGPPVSAFRPAVDDLDALLAGVVEVELRLGALRPRLAQVERARRAATLVAERVRETEGVRSRDPSSALAAMADDLRAVLDTLERDVGSGLDRLDRELRHVREAADRLRLAPAGTLFTFLERAVRDVARTLDKRVTFEASGGDVRVEPSVLNVIQGALLHVVRNAAAHGIEDGDVERRRAGKPVEGRVVLRVSRRGRLVSFACTDDGRGIDLEAVRRIAQRKGLGRHAGRQLGSDELLRLLLSGGISTSGSVTDVSGRGIGLDVAREAAERLGGEVTARTEAGKGTTIELVVPLPLSSHVVMRPLPACAPATSVVAGTVLDAVGDPQLVLDPDGLVSEARRGEPSTCETPPPRSRVLVVDDSLTTRMLERTILESAGYDVDVAASGEEALHRARAAPYALLVVDVEMPGMDGFTLIERIRADPGLQGIPAVLVTTRNSPDDRERGRAVGAQGYVVKSEFDQGVLLEHIRTLVE